MIEPITGSTGAQYWLDSYRDYLERVLGLAPITRRKYLFVVGRLLETISLDGTVDPSFFTADSISEFVRHDAAPRTGQGRRQSITPVRSFLRFLISRGVLRPGLETVVPKIRSWPQAALPQQLSETEINRLLQMCVDDTRKGRRNHAVLMLLSRFGLRAQEVASLQLSDIDWTNGSVLIRSRKTHCERVLPLPKDLAESLLGYLRKGRPHTVHREVFIQPVAPFDPIKPDAVTKLVARLLSKAGIQRRAACCAHLFRHTIATQMVNRGVSFKDIADLLGHQTLQTTAIYARLNLTTLSQIALPWPGGEQ